jgi:adenylate cyclase
MVGWLQLAAVFLFGVLYTAAPKTFSTDSPIEPVPWFLSIYLLLTVGRLVLAHRRKLSPLLLYLSIIIDIGLLLGMIWAFHRQYQQPATFYLKSPTLLYVFIFISLRALRFEARYVIAAGIFAAAGWILLAVYAAWAAGGLEPLTRDYVHYMTSNSILIGAELDKVITILTVTVILAIAITRARDLLVSTVVESAAARDLSRFFAPEIARQITSAEQVAAVGQGKMREAAILITDIRGFTAIAAQTEPDELMQLLAAYQSRLVPIIEQNNGSIDKFMGDGIMATFGAVAPSDRYAADAIRAAEQIAAEAASWQHDPAHPGKPALAVGTAVANGRVIFGAVGNESRLEYTVIGEAVNLCAKLEKHTKTVKATALCSADAHRTAVSQGYRPESEPDAIQGSMVEGLPEPVDIVALAKGPENPA